MKIGRSLIVFILQVFTDDGILVLLDAQVEVTARVAYIIRITRIDLFRLYILFSQYRSCDDTQEI